MQTDYFLLFHKGIVLGIYTSWEGRVKKIRIREEDGN